MRTGKKTVLWMTILALVMIVFPYQSSQVKAASIKKEKEVVLRANNRDVTKRDLTIGTGSKVKLNIGGFPAKSIKSIKYESRKKSIATVSKKGIVTAEKAGSAKITVTVKGIDGSKKTSWVHVKVRDNLINVKIEKQIFTATLTDNSSASALKELLAKGSLSIRMNDYADMEKVGPLGVKLPRNDKQIHTKAGDLILYQGNQFVIYYASNSWELTRLGRINDITGKELRKALGKGSVRVTLFLD